MHKVFQPKNQFFVNWLTYDYRNSSVEVLGIYQYNIKNSIKVGFNVFDEKYDYIKGAKDTGVPTALEKKKDAQTYL
jgi:hypothetical protein